jgi:hypothetical protein
MWTLGANRIIVTNIEDDDQAQIVAKLQPLEGGTVYQTFGYENPISKLDCYVVSKEEMDAIRSLTTSGDTFELVSPEGSMGFYFVMKVSPKRVYSVCQTIRPDLDSDAPVYLVTIELNKEYDA